MDEEAIFTMALELKSADRRAAYLDEACAGQAELRRKVEQLLSAHLRGGSFLDEAAAAWNAQLPLPAPTASDGPGTQIGPYKLLEQIGEGGMGLVFMAEQSQPLRRRVALKVLKPGMETRQVVARFEAERQALALMDHSHIAKVFDAGLTASGRPYFVMELVRGVPITQYCDERRLSTRQRLELFVTVCQAVQHAHQKGVIHRDLKPSNVLVSHHDTVAVPKIIDFGIAKATTQPLTERTLFTHFAQMVGTPLYMSPEQAELNGLDVDTRTDVYALGVMLYELLTGMTPFESDTLKKVGLDEMRRMIREEEPPTPSRRFSTMSAQACSTISERRGVDGRRLGQTLRGELDWIVMKALEKDRDRRYESASALAADVQRYLNDEAVEACPPALAYRLRKFARRNRVAFVMAAVAVAALIGFGVACLFAYRNQLTEQQRLADQQAHEGQLVAAKQQSALERALMAAMSGDFDGAEKAIDDAELLGASAGQVRMLRGQVAFHRGDIEKASRHLEQAAKLLPDGKPGAVAARAILALAYAYGLHLHRVDELSRELDLLSPITAEDYLFKGQFEAIIRPERGLEALDEAIRRRDSVIARVARCEGRAQRALNTGRESDAESALEDAQVARAMLPGNPLVLGRSVYAQLAAAGIYESNGRATDRERVLAQARRDVEGLKPFAASPFAAQSCCEYFEYVGDDEAAYATGEQGNHFRRAALLYRRGEFAKALDAALQRGRSRAPGLADQVEGAFILAELPDGPARAQAAFEEARADARGGWQWRLPMILLLLGKPEQARQAYLQVRMDKPPPWDDGWLVKYLEYNRGRLTSEQLLRAAGQARRKRSDAHFVMGLWRLSEGDRADAREQFQQCLVNRGIGFWESPWARAFLARMERDRAWPPWIPSGK